MRVKKMWTHIHKGFKEAEEFDRNYYVQMTPEERLNIVQELREFYFKFNKENLKGLNKNASRKRLRRVIKVVQQRKS